MPRYEDYDDDSDLPYWEEQRFHDIWEDTANQRAIDDAQDRTNYSADEIEQAHVELFMQYVAGEDRDTQESLWEAYIETMVNGGDHDQFFEDMGIEPADFDWNGWREAMGY